MSRKNTREIELAFSKHRDPDWEADVEIYGKRVLKTVRGICLGDEWTEIDSLKNKDWIELSDMFGNFDNHNPYFNHSPQYVLLDKFSITSPVILCSNEIVMKNGKVLSVDNISANLSGENEVYKIYSNTKYDDYTYYDESKNLVFELASKDVDKIIRFMRDFMDVLRDSKLTKYRNSSFLWRLFNTLDMPYFKQTYSMNDLKKYTNTFRSEVCGQLKETIPNFKYTGVPMGGYIERYFELSYVEEVQKFIKEQEDKKCEEIK